MRLLVLTLLAVAAVLVAVVVLAAVFQERVVWQPPSTRWSAPVDVPSVRGAAYVAEDGQRLIGFVVAPWSPWMLDDDTTRALRDSVHAADDPVDAERLRRELLRRREERLSAPPRWNGHVLIAFHGNAETAGSRTQWALDVAVRSGWTVFVPEYRGYSGLPGRPTYAGSQADARAAYAFVRDSLGVPPERIAIHGFSLGTAVAAELAREVGPSVLVLEAPFTSVRDMARAGAVAPVGLLWRWIARVHFDTRSRVAELDAPVWVIHGSADMIIPVRMGRAVHAAARVKGEYVEVAGAGHNDLPSRGRREYRRWLDAALAAAVGRGGGS